MLIRLVYLALVIVLGLAIIAVFRIPQLRVVQDVAFEALAPLESLAAGPSSTLAQFTQTVRTIQDLRAENARLRAQVDSLSQQAVLVPELQRENAQLRAQLQLKEDRSDFQWISADIIAYDPSNLVQSITIAKGGRDGVQQGMTVMTPAGLVGQVVQVTPVTSKVLLITDISSSVDSETLVSRAHGVVYGTRGNLLDMRYIPQGVTIKSGDTIVTSGIGGIYPPGIVIGSVTGVRQNDVDPDQEAQLEPAVDLGHLEQVLVITNHVPTPLQ